MFGNGSNFFTPGLSTLIGDPLFVAAGDFHVLPTSPATDSGQDSDVPSDLTTDLDGAPRIQGIVDIGVYEEAPEPSQLLSLACGLLLLYALPRRRLRDGARQSRSPRSA